MKKSVHTIYIRSKSFQSSVICEGVQIAEIVREIDALLPSLAWYVADIEFYDYLDDQHPRDPKPVAIGDANALIEFSRSVSQFLSGVFAGVPRGIETPRFRDGGLWSEDTGEEVEDLGDSVIEVRAFDTSWIEVTSRDRDVIGALRDRFGADSG